MECETIPHGAPTPYYCFNVLTTVNNCNAINTMLVEEHKNRINLPNNSILNPRNTPDVIIKMKNAMNGIDLSSFEIGKGLISISINIPHSNKKGKI